MDHFSYYMLRLRRRGEPAPGPGVTGIVQQLSTGEKRAFADAGELLDLLLDWPGPQESKVSVERRESNAALPEEDRG